MRKGILLISLIVLTFLGQMAIFSEAISADFTTEKAEELSSLGYYELAEERLEQASLFYDRWQNGKKAEYFQQAVIYAASATEIRPDWDKPWLLLGMLYSELKADQKAMELAVESLINAVDANPANSRAQILLANVLLEQGRFFSAIEQYKSLFAKNEKMITGITITPLTIAYIADGRMTAGINYLKDLTEQHPDNHSIIIGLAVLLKNNQQLEEARQLLRQLLGKHGLKKQKERYITNLLNSWGES